MDYHELDIMAQRARNEAEAFINTNIHNRMKKWPRICSSQIFLDQTTKIPCTIGQKNDCNFDTQILSSIT